MGTIRQARLQDARAIGRIEVDTWRSTYAGMLPDRVLLAMSEQRQTASWAGFLRHRAGDVWVAQQPRPDAGEARLVGFGNCGPQREGGLGYAGEVYTLYVASEAQGHGFGRLLLLALFARLVDQGCGSAIIWVLRDNPGRFFYQRLGGQEIQRKMFAVGGKRVEASGYGWRDLPSFLGTKAEADRSPEP